MHPNRPQAYSQPFLASSQSRSRVLSMALDVEEICTVIPEVCADVEADADAVFSIIDKDGNGMIEREELRNHLSKAGYAVKAVDLIFDKLDTNADEMISRDELRAGFLKYTPLREAPGLGTYNAKFVEEIHEDADRLFSTLDRNGDGSIEPIELRDHLKQFSDYSPRAIGNIFLLLDVNKDGEIERGELRDAFVKYSALRQAIGEGPNFK
eukprot:CAMPEP_0119299446 /NCGR_PEP_ID=MMETSP1333-20130426/1522_1 /TAXON_ID=418940 /ORGANISM="Scyphosphaera apsteinii, Strain RCC1455" /LENGTH=209 /DNA_ID=CAMNT_0007300885 /DNA_START=167 /DNA_END=796 /DNA_ORIENTATION=+